MAVPTTRAGLSTRALAVRIELAELAAGATTLAGGLDGGTQRQKDACAGLAQRLDQDAKALSHQVVSDTIANLT
jgi:hypothetical protein